MERSKIVEGEKAALYKKEVRCLVIKKAVGFVVHLLVAMPLSFLAALFVWFVALLISGKGVSILPILRVTYFAFVVFYFLMLILSIWNYVATSRFIMRKFGADRLEAHMATARFHFTRGKMREWNRREFQIHFGREIGRSLAEVLGPIGLARVLSALEAESALEDEPW